MKGCSGDPNPIVRSHHEPERDSRRVSVEHDTASITPLPPQIHHSTAHPQTPLDTRRIPTHHTPTPRSQALRPPQPPLRLNAASLSASTATTHTRAPARRSSAAARSVVASVHRARAPPLRRQQQPMYVGTYLDTYPMQALARRGRGRGCLFPPFFSLLR